MRVITIAVADAAAWAHFWRWGCGLRVDVRGRHGSLRVWEGERGEKKIAFEHGRSKPNEFVQSSERAPRVA